MKKLPLNYKNQVVGYVDEIIYDDNGEVKDAYIYLYQNEYIDEIINNIKRGLIATLNKNPNIDNLENNTLYQIELEDDLLILRKLKA
jgi:hypothetical protein